MDAENVRRALTFAAQDFSIDIVRCLQDGVEALRTETYDALLLDLTLPDSYGIGTVQRMLEEFDRLPIIVLTGVDDQGLALDSVKLGVQDYLTKDDNTADRLPQAIEFAVQRAQSAALAPTGDVTAAE